MTITPASYNALVYRLQQQQQQYDQLSTQLGTGLVGNSYADLGPRRATALNIQAQLSGYDSYAQTQTIVDTRLQVIQTTLSDLNTISLDQAGDNATTPFSQASNGQSIQQISAAQRLDQLIGLLNQDVSGRTLFSGRATNKEASVPSDVLINGTGSQAGLRQVIAERNQADSGTDGLGRLTITQAGTTTTLSETASGPFGYKIASSGSNLSNATLTQAAGPPTSVAVNFTGVPNANETVNLSFTLPDGTQSTVTLQAVTGTPSAGQFQIGVDAATTAANFTTALNSAIQQETNSALVPASTVAAANGFFDVSATQAPQRVAFTPPATAATATSLRNGTSTDTVFWYTGDDATDNPRGTATARVDTNLTVGYGVRATEPAIRNLVANLAIFAAVQFDPTDPNVQTKYQSLSLKLRANLNDTTGQTIQGISTEIAGVQTTVKDASDRQNTAKSILQNVLSGIENVDSNTVAVQLNALSNQMQATYQTTSTISKLSLVNYL